MTNPFKHPDFKIEAEYIKGKREAAIKYLGDKWLLANANKVQKKVKHDTRNSVSNSDAK